MIYFSFIVSVLDFLIVFFMIIHIIKSWNSEIKGKFKKINEIMYVIITASFGIYYPISILHFGESYSGILFATAIQDFIFFGNLLIVGVIFMIFLWALSAKLRVLKNPELKKTKNNYELFCKNFIEEYSKCSIRNKVKRKFYHTIPFAVVGSIIIIFFNFRFIFGNVWSNYAFFFIIILGVDFAFTFLIGDIVRLLDFSFMPENASKLFRAGMTDHELDSFTSTSVMVFSFGPFILAPFPIFIIVLLTSAVSDAFASIFGILAGDNKHNFPKGSDKSLEGYFGGFLTTFLASIFGILFSNFFGFSSWSWDLITFTALISSLTFLAIDLLTSKVKLQDNYLNPIIIGTVLLIFLTIINP